MKQEAVLRRTWGFNMITWSSAACVAGELSLSLDVLGRFVDLFSMMSCGYCISDNFRNDNLIIQRTRDKSISNTTDCYSYPSIKPGPL